MPWETNHQRYPHHFVAVSPIANRYSPFAVVFGSAGTSFSQFVPVPRPTTLVPLWVGAQVSRHKLRTEIRSVVCFWLHCQP